MGELPTASAFSSRDQDCTHRVGTGLMLVKPMNFNRPIMVTQQNKLGDHNGAIEIHWLVYTFPWWQPESTRGACPFHVACGPL